MPCKNLRAEMARERVTIGAVADLIGRTRDTVANKIDGDSNFTIEEAQEIRDKFFPGLTLEYLFAKEAENND